MASVFEDTDYQDYFMPGQGGQQTPASQAAGQGQQLFSTASDIARNAISPESRDRAAARLRAATDQARLSNEAEIGGQMARRGVNTSGLAESRQMQNRAQAQAAFAQGLGTMEDQWARQDLEAAGVIGQQAQGLGNLATNQVQTNLQGQQIRNTNAKNVADTRLQGLLTYLTQGNVIQDPTRLAGIFGDLGIDTSGLQFYAPGTQPPGTPGTGTGGTTTYLPGPGGSTIGTGGGGGTGAAPLPPPVTGGGSGGGTLVETINSPALFTNFPELAPLQPTYTALSSALSSSGLQGQVNLSVEQARTAVQGGVAPQFNITGFSNGFSQPAREVLRRTGGSTLTGRNSAEIRAQIDPAIVGLAEEINKTRGGGSSAPFYTPQERAAMTADLNRLRALRDSLRNVRF